MWSPVQHLNSLKPKRENSNKTEIFNVSSSYLSHSRCYNSICFCCRTDHWLSRASFLLEQATIECAWWELVGLPREHLFYCRTQADPTSDLPNTWKATDQRRTWSCWGRRGGPGQRARQSLRTELTRAERPSCTVRVLEANLPVNVDGARIHG